MAEQMVKSDIQTSQRGTCEHRGYWRITTLARVLSNLIQLTENLRPDFTRGKQRADEWGLSSDDRTSKTSPSSKFGPEIEARGLSVVR
jgi:hypothetical protein